MTTNTPAGDSKKKSPLDVLEDILEDSKNAAAGSTTVDPNAAALQEEKKLLEVKKQQEEHAKEDQVDIQKSLQEIANLKNSPQAKAADNQDKAKVQEKQDHQEKMKGIEIIQLGHKKIEVEEN